jgi:hypothetical protein
MQLFLYDILVFHMYHAVIQFYIHFEFMIDLKFILIKVTKLKIDMWIELHKADERRARENTYLLALTLHVIFKLYIPS